MGNRGTGPATTPGDGPTTGATRVQASPRAVGVTISALLLAMLLAALDQTIVSTALPTIVSDLGGMSELSWVVTAYLLAVTASTPLWGKLGDMYGRKRLFQTAIVIFLVGSTLCGIAQNMGELIGFRALQGLGGGGLMVLTQAIVGDVVAPRERGRYQGFFGAVFGVTSVVGPLLGGLFTEHLSWRWVFYINVPIGVLALLVIAVVLRIPRFSAEHRIDYLGTVLVAGFAGCVVLGTSMGGTTWAWGSWQIIGLGVLAALLLAVLIAVERQAAEPVLPMRLFRIRSFSLVAVIAFIVGVAMFGSLTFMPTFLQVVHGVSPTMSGVHMLPMVLGLLATSIASGQIISHTGRYRFFPIVGSAAVTAAMLLLSRMDEHTSTTRMSLNLLLLGLGIGMVMQVLVLVAQNAVNYSDLGVATSGVTFFRSIGASFGVAAFGTVFANLLATKISRALAGAHLPAGVDISQAKNNPHLVDQLPPSARGPYLHAYADALTSVFLVAAPVALLAFLLAWFLKEIPLRRAVATGERGAGMTAAPTERSSLDEVTRALTLLSSQQTRREIYERIARRAEVALSPEATWMLLRLHRVRAEDPVRMSEVSGVPLRRLDAAATSLEVGGSVVRRGRELELSAAGSRIVERLVEARREGLAALLGDWNVEQHDELATLLGWLADQLGGQDADGPEAAGARFWDRWQRSDDAERAA